MTINTAILTADELEQINSIVEAAKARDAAMRSQQQSQSSNDSKLVSLVTVLETGHGHDMIFNVTLSFQDAILSTLTSMQGRINTLETKNAAGPVLNQQPLQIPFNQYGQYGFVNPLGQMTNVPPPPGFGMGPPPSASQSTGLIGHGLGHGLGQGVPANVLVTPPNSAKNSDTSVSAVFLYIHYKLKAC